MGVGTQPPLIRRCGYKAFPTEALTTSRCPPCWARCRRTAAGGRLASIPHQTTTRGRTSSATRASMTREPRRPDHSLPYCLAAVAATARLPSSFEQENLVRSAHPRAVAEDQVGPNAEIDALSGHQARHRHADTNDGRRVQPDGGPRQGQPAEPAERR